MSIQAAPLSPSTGIHLLFGEKIEPEILFIYFNKYILQFGQIYFTIKTNTFNIVDKYIWIQAAALSPLKGCSQKLATKGEHLLQQGSNKLNLKLHHKRFKWL